MRRLSLYIAALITGLVLLTPASAAGHHRSLDQQARWVATHGGILGTGMFEATPQLQRLVRRLIVKHFSPFGSAQVRWARCVIRHESGFNPGAVNKVAIAPDYPVAGAGHASGLAQFVVYYHRWINRWRLLRDPGYAVRAMVRLSNGGHDRSAWKGGGYSCR